MIVSRVHPKRGVQYVRRIVFRSRYKNYRPLRTGMALLKADPDRFKALNPPNGWGRYEGLVTFVEAYLAACIENPDATIEASR